MLKEINEAFDIGINYLITHVNYILMKTVYMG